MISTFETHDNSNDSSDKCGMATDPVSSYLWQIIPPILLLVGITGNILSIIVLVRLGFRRHPTLTFLLYLAVNDTVVLITGLPQYWIYYIAKYDIRKAHSATCKLNLFLIYLSMQYSSWILVGVAAERLVKTYFPFKYHRFYTSGKVSIGLLLTLFVLVLVNGHFFFTNGINEYTDGCCGSLDDNFFFFDEHIFIFIDFGLLCAIPFTIMLICNIFLVRILRAEQRHRATMMHHSMVRGANKFSVRMTKMLVVCTFYFLIATAPNSIWFILDTYLTSGLDTQGKTTMDQVRTITYLIQFTNYCINFYLYTAMNDRFFEELKNLLCCLTSFRLSMLSSTRQKGSDRSDNSLAQRSVVSTSLGIEENSLSEDNRLSSTSEDNRLSSTSEDNRL